MNANEEMFAGNAAADASYPDGDPWMHGIMLIYV